MILKHYKSAIVYFVLCIPTTAFSQGFGPGFSSSYQFRSDNDRAVKSGVVDLIEKKKAGMYQAPIFNSTTTTNVAGDQINCDLVATTIGNSGSAITDGSSGAPSVLNSPTVQAASVGNQAGREEGGPLNSSGGSNTINTSQDVSGLTQASNVDKSTQGGVSGEVGGSSSALSQESENDQSVAGSPLNSNIAGSSACSWN
jgi:hypothetical protein